MERECDKQALLGAGALGRQAPIATGPAMRSRRCLEVAGYLLVSLPALRAWLTLATSELAQATFGLKRRVRLSAQAGLPDLLCDRWRPIGSRSCGLPLRLATGSPAVSNGSRLRQSSLTGTIAYEPEGTLTNSQHESRSKLCR
jgi:hypothetical protein